MLWGSLLAIKIGCRATRRLGTSIRMLIAGVLMYAVLRWRGEAAPTRKQWRAIFVLAILLTVMSNALVNLAEQTVSTGLVAIGVAAMPLWAGLFSALRGEHSSAREWLGIAIGLPVCSG